MATRTNKQRERRAASDGRGERLRVLPSVDECLRAADRKAGWSEFRRDYIALVVRRALDGVRQAIAAGAGGLAGTREAMLEEVMRRADQAIAADQPSLQSVINATGVVIHTNLGRAMLAEPAIDAVEQAARAPVNLEYDLEAGARGDRDALVEEELCALTGAEAATVVNNNAAAVLLALNSIAEGREVIVSRGELIEIGGSFRLPDVMLKSGARLREVGTTNRTHPEDYLRAIGPDTALLLKVHPSNYRVVGFSATVDLRELVELARPHRIEVMEDLGSGALIDLGAYGLPREPVVADRIAAGAGLVTFSGDKLLGGPQAGVVVGKRELIARLKANPLKRALRCGKLTLAALSATLRLYLRSADLGASIPTLRLMRRTVGELEAIAGRARTILLERLGGEFQIEIAPATSQIGSGAMPTEELETRVLRVSNPRLSADAIARHFRGARPPIIGRIKDGAFHLDLRTVEDPAAFAVSFPKG
ncbi:MAG: L-seryl-tRNA(Sec) selenium transferase [Candidatus Binataceae bacterium]